MAGEIMPRHVPIYAKGIPTVPVPLVKKVTRAQVFAIMLQMHAGGEGMG